MELCGIVSEKGFTDSEGRRAILFQDLFNTYRQDTGLTHKRHTFQFIMLQRICLVTQIALYGSLNSAEKLPEHEQ